MNNKFKIAAIIILSVFSLAFSDGWSEQPLGTDPQKVQWLVTKDNGTTFVKFVNINRYYSFSNKPSFLSTLLTAKSTGLSVRIYSSTAPSGEGSNGLPDLGNSNQSYQLAEFSCSISNKHGIK